MWEPNAGETNERDDEPPKTGVERGGRDGWPSEDLKTVVVMPFI